MPFTLHLVWADDIAYFVISSQRTTRAESSPSPANPSS
jgi:hypothetical protein